MGAPDPDLADIWAAASAGQRRLWVLAQLAADPAVYAITAALSIHGPLDAASLSRALDLLVARHKSLRTVLAASPVGSLAPASTVANGNDPAGHGVHAPDQFISVRQRILSPSANGFALDIVSGDAALPPLDIDLAAGPLFRARLTRLAPDRHRLELALHHAVGDGWSIGVLSRELGALYHAQRHGAPLPLRPLPLQYRHFAARQDAWLAGPGGAAARRYWLDTLSCALPTLDLPADAPRPAVQTFNGALHHLTLKSACIDAMRTLAMRHGTTLFAVLLAGVNALLHRYTGLSDIIMGMRSPAVTRPISRIRSASI